MDTSISVSLYVWKIWLFLQQEPILLQISHLPLNMANLIFLPPASHDDLEITSVSANNNTASDVFDI